MGGTGSLTLLVGAIAFQDYLFSGSNWKAGFANKSLTRLESVSPEAVVSLSEAPPPRMAVENCDFPSFAGLTSQQQALIGDQSTWESLNSPKLLASFLNITGGLGAAGIDLSQLTLQDNGIHQDRLLFNPSSNEALQSMTAANPSFRGDQPAAIFHPGMADWGFRQYVEQNSLQIGGGGGGTFVDIDPWHPTFSARSRRGHTADVLKGMIGIKTNPFKVGSGLGQGITNYKCK